MWDAGTATIAKIMSQTVPGLTISGAEYSPRADCAIPCLGFDGVHLPFPDQSFDGCMFVDVLHHSRDPLAILLDASRVCRNFILIKDHVAESSPRPLDPALHGLGRQSAARCRTAICLSVRQTVAAALSRCWSHRDADRPSNTALSPPIFIGLRQEPALHIAVLKKLDR